ncbi:MAG: hypothetical protein KJ950_03735 [Proteobacteria bacterium]|nr:hypothetical protein [Pseudomonadota bacterium]MBU1688320.1 hypothetical protein [Pseudomonadota bacterium]
MTEKLDTRWESDIDGAVDNLFGQYVVKAPGAGASPPPKAAPEAPPELDLSMENEPEGSKAPPAQEIELSLEEVASPPPTAQTPLAAIFEKMDEALLTIDWEVSHKSLTNARQILKDVISTASISKDTPVSQVVSQMDTVLASMLQSPQATPVSAPGQLKSAFNVVKKAIAQGNTLDSDIRKLLSTTLSDLYTAVAETPGNEPLLDLSGDSTASSSPAPPKSDIPTDLGFELSLESNDSSSHQGQSVPDATGVILRSYAASLEGSVKRITPMEKLFSNKPGMEKLHTVNRQVREKLASQLELLSRSFTANYSSYTGIGTVDSLLESQLDILTPCVKRMRKLENLFEKTAGYDKLFELASKVRKSLSDQQDAIIKLVGGTPIDHQFDLTGEFEPIQPATSPPPAAPAATIAAATDPMVLIDDCLILAASVENETDMDLSSRQELGQKLTENLKRLKITLTSGASMSTPAATAAALKGGKCRWDWLLKATWGGQQVGFVPEQVVYEGTSTLSPKAMSKLGKFPLSKLKSWPWTNLQNLFSGDLAQLSSVELSKMEFEIASVPGTFPGSSAKKVYLLIMYANKQGKVFLLDTPTEAVSISEENLWTPGPAGSDLAGTLTIYGNVMPVVSLS